MSGYDIKRFLKSFSWLVGSPSFGGLYPALRALLQEGLVTEDSSLYKGRRPRKVYSITEAGERALQDWINQPLAPDTPLKSFAMRLILASKFPRPLLIAHLQQRRSQVAVHLATLAQITGVLDEEMDLEERLVHCMVKQQGFSKGDKEVKKRHGSGSDMMKLMTYIAMQSNGMKWNPPLDHPLEKAMRDAGEELFYRRSGPMDFSCAACHAETGKRIRASVLPNMLEPAEWTKGISWPAERVGQGNVRSTNHRLRGCVWQMRHPGIKAGSDASIALISFWTDAARGQPAILPDLKR